MRKLIGTGAVLLSAGLAVFAQTVDFDQRSFPDSPIIFTGSLHDVAPGVPRRQFVTVQNESKRAVAAVIFEQSVAVGGKIVIVAIEHVGILIQPHEKKRVSLAVDDMMQNLQSEGERAGKPMLTVVAVEFAEGSRWNAPPGSSGSAHVE